MKEDVGRLEIPMQYIFIVEFLEGTPKLIENLQGLTLSQFSFRFDVFGQSASTAVLVNKIIVVGSPQHLNKFDDVGMVDLRQDSDLIIGELTEFWSMLEFLHIHHLDRIELRILLVFCLVDVTVLPLPYLLHQNIVLDNFVH